MWLKMTLGVQRFCLILLGILGFLKSNMSPCPLNIRHSYSLAISLSPQKTQWRGDDHSLYISARWPCFASHQTSKLINRWISCIYPPGPKDASGKESFSLGFPTKGYQRFIGGDSVPWGVDPMDKHLVTLCHTRFQHVSATCHLRRTSGAWKRFWLNSHHLKSDANEVKKTNGAF